MRTEELLKNIAAVRPLWQDEWEPNARMLDFEEKWAAFHDPAGRVMVCAHRGDRNELYPENSLEGFLSARMAGADMLEADIRVTSDGVPIVMHDETLTRTTNLPLLRQGGEAWLPHSDAVADWTLAQVRRLRLISPSGAVSECAVPTLEELILLARGHCFITLDKAGSFSFEEAVMPLLEKHSAWRTVLIPYEYSFERVMDIQKSIKEKCGQYAPYFAKAVRCGKMDVERIERGMRFLQENNLSPILRGGEFDAEDETVIPLLRDTVKGKYRLYAESLHEEHDNEENWRRMVDAGCGILMGNHNYALLKFLKASHFEG